MSTAQSLSGKNGLIIGMANEHSIAFGCAVACINAGARVMVACQNETARRFAAPPLQIFLQTGQVAALAVCDLSDAAQPASLADEFTTHFDTLDFLIHSVAFAPATDLHGRVTDTSRAGFAQAMDISCHSLIRLARAFEKKFIRGGSIITMTYYGAEKVVPQYNVMGPVKAALEASVRELASELGPAQIRVNAISPGPIATRAASGITDFLALSEAALVKSPQHRLPTIGEVGAVAAFLASDAAAAITGAVIPVDAGYHIMA